MDLDELQQKVIAFRDARDWKQFHAPHRLAAAISIEAAELQECFLWKTDSEVAESVVNVDTRAKMAEELADILIFALMLSNELQINPGHEILRKLASNEAKYPIEKAKGRAAKYTNLDA